LIMDQKQWKINQIVLILMENGPMELWGLLAFSGVVTREWYNKKLLEVVSDYSMHEIDITMADEEVREMMGVKREEERQILEDVRGLKVGNFREAFKWLYVTAYKRVMWGEYTPHGENEHDYSYLKAWSFEDNFMQRHACEMMLGKAPNMKLVYIASHLTSVNIFRHRMWFMVRNKSINFVDTGPDKYGCDGIIAALETEEFLNLNELRFSHINEYDVPAYQEEFNYVYHYDTCRDWFTMDVFYASLAEVQETNPQRYRGQRVINVERG